MRLRLLEYSKSFESDEAATMLSQNLSEMQPAFTVSGSVLRQWYMKFHPQSKPLEYHSAVDLDHALGDEIRLHYAGLRSSQLQATLSSDSNQLLSNVKWPRLGYRSMGR